MCESFGALFLCFEACVLGVGKAEQGAAAWPAALLHLCCVLTVTPAFGCVGKCVLSLFCAQTQTHSLPSSLLSLLRCRHWRYCPWFIWLASSSFPLFLLPSLSLSLDSPLISLLFPFYASPLTLRSIQFSAGSLAADLRGAAGFLKLRRRTF